MMRICLSARAGEQDEEAPEVFFNVMLMSKYICIKHIINTTIQTPHVCLPCGSLSRLSVIKGIHTEPHLLIRLP